MSKKIWFTGCTHYGHKNIIKLSNRPFSDIEQHDDILINNYNKLVSSDDTCYFLGDFAWNQSFENYKRLFSRLNGKKFFVLGNHDNRQNIIKCKKEGLLIDVFENKTIQIGNDKIYLSHFPHREWNCFYHNSYHLYSHCHGNIEDYKQSTDIGVDCWEYEPVEWSEVKEYIDKNCEINI